MKPRAAEVYLRPSNLNLGGLGQGPGAGRGASLLIASHRVAPHSIASCHSALRGGSAAALRARVLYEYIHETDSRHDGRRTLTCSEHGTVDHSTRIRPCPISLPALLPAQHTHIHSQLRWQFVVLVGPSQQPGRLTGETKVWTDVLRENGASGVCRHRPSPLGIALIPTSLDCPRRLTILSTAVPRTVCLCTLSHRGLVISGNRGSTIQTVLSPGAQVPRCCVSIAHTTVSRAG